MLETSGDSGASIASYINKVELFSRQKVLVHQVGLVVQEA